ncbi:MAG: hypothetical protein KJ011_03515, partial [Burkholderiaceae bacterium]|nr:hypothetical protein [Burkholderiaceae bacterium]
MNRVFVLTTIDTEEEWDWDAPLPASPPSVANTLQLESFQDLCDRYGMKTTYFTNFAVMQNPESRRVIERLASRDGCEIGMHIHPWHTPPITAFDESEAEASFLHNHPAEAIRSKPDTVHSALRESGITATSFRGGRYSTDRVIQKFLHEHGFVADCSVVPYTTWPDDGAPDFRARDIFPVRRPPLRDGQRALWEIPLSLGFSRAPFRLWSRCFDIVEHTALARLRLIGLAERLGLVRRIWLNFELDDRSDWAPFLLLLQRMGVPCVTLTVHSSSLVAGPGPYTRTPADEQRIRGRIESVFAVLRRLPGFVPATATEVARH